MLLYPFNGIGLISVFIPGVRGTGIIKDYSINKSRMRASRLWNSLQNMLTGLKYTSLSSNSFTEKTKSFTEKTKISRKTL